MRPCSQLLMREPQRSHRARGLRLQTNHARHERRAHPPLRRGNRLGLCSSPSRTSYPSRPPPHLTLHPDLCLQASNYAASRIVFNRPIGQNQGIAHPLAASWVKLEACRLMIMQAARMFDAGFETGEYANACKYLAGETAFSACETAVCTLGGMGYAKEYV